VGFRISVRRIVGADQTADRAARKLQ
jgi:hypothetical protein